MLRSIAQRLRADPRFFIFSGLVLALGIGSNTAVFSVLYSVLLRPLPYEDPSRIFLLQEVPADGSQSYGDMSMPALEEWRRRARCLDAVGGRTAMLITVMFQGRPDAVMTELVTPEYFEVLGVAPALGRTLRERSPGEEAPREVVLGHSVWQREFAADRGVIGDSLQVGDSFLTIVGVMPRGFRHRTPVWTPISIAPVLAPQWGNLSSDPGARRFRSYVRASSACTPQALDTEIEQIAAQLGKEFPATHAGVVARLAPLRELTSSAYLRPLLLLQVAGLAVLAVVCINYAQLQRVHWNRRLGDVAVRSVLGAGTRRLVAGLVAESLSVSLVAGSIGAVAAVSIAASWLRNAPILFPGQETVRFEGAVVGVALAGVCMAGILAVLRPAVLLARSDLTRLMRGRGGASAKLGSRRGFALVVVAQTAASTVLLLATALLLQTYLQLTDAELGFETERGLALGLAIPPDRYDTAAEVDRFYESALREVSSLAVVERATVATDSPQGGFSCHLMLEEADDSNLARPLELPCQYVGLGYHETLGVPLLEGRDLEASDFGEGADRVIVNRRLATQLWPERSAVGRTLSVRSTAVEGPFPQTTSLTVVGVFADVRRTPANQPQSPLVFLPRYSPYMTLLVRTRAEPLASARAVKEAVWRVDGEQPFFYTQSFEEVVDRQTLRQRLSASFVSAFSASALANAGLGLFALLGYQVASRRKELAIRLAVGASPRRLLGTVVGISVLLAGVGCALGLALTLPLAGLAESMIFGVRPYDPATVGAVLAVSMVVALLGSWGPGHAASTIEPAEQLRTE